VPLLVRRTLFLLALALGPMLVVLWHGQATKRDLGETLAERSAERLRAEGEAALGRGLDAAAKALAGELSQTALVVAARARAAERALARADARAMPPDRRRAFVASRVAAADDQLDAQAPLGVPWRATVFADQDRADGLPAALAAPGTDPRDARWYRSAVLLGGTVWDGPRPGPEPGSLVVIAATPVFAPDQSIAGVGAAGFDVARNLRTAAADIGVAGLELTVLAVSRDDAGTVRVLATSDSGTAPWTERVDAATRAHLIGTLGDTSYKMQALTIGDTPHLFASEPVFAGVAHLVAVVPYAAIDAAARSQSQAFAATTRRHLILSAGLAVAVAAVVIVIAFAGAKRQARPIQELTDAMRRIARGDLSPRLIAKRRDEWGRLAVAVNRIVPALAERLHMHRDLDLAEEVQAHLLPADPPAVDGLDVAFSYRASDRMGGDYVDFIETGFGPCAVVADVSGHGAAAALLMATARAFTRAHAPQATDPGDLLTRLNRDLARDVSGGRFMTALCLALSADGAPMAAGAGHHPLLIMDAADGRVRAVEADGIPLGIDADARYDAGPLPTPEGPWTLLAATDGLEETPDPGGRRLGQAAVAGVLRNHTGAEAQTLVDAVLSLRERHAAGAAATDDVTVLVVAKG
jgi:sigma-B regulation protein RsbU (phosphoserine phosphatase)